MVQDRILTCFDTRRFAIALAAAGLSQAALARRLRLAEHRLSAYAHGMVPPPERRAAIASALGVDERALWRRWRVPAEGIAPDELTA